MSAHALYSFHPQQLFQQKLLLCSIMFNFEDANSDKRGKDLKRNTLLELVDYVNSASGQKELFTEVLMPDIMACVSANICRALPPQVLPVAIMSLTHILL
jgi:serine/threonine-protein phosphatase 2A regulatory subunit B'